MTELLHYIEEGLVEAMGGRNLKILRKWFGNDKLEKHGNLLQQQYIQPQLLIDMGVI